MKLQSIFITVIAIPIIGFVIYWEQFITGLGILSCFLMALIGFALPGYITDVLERYNCYWVIACIFLFLSTIFHLSIGVRVLSEEDNVKVVSSYYPYGRILGVGHKIDTLFNMARCYRLERNYEVKRENMYILEKDSSIMLFSKYDLIIEGKDLHFKERELGHGKLHICSYFDKTGRRQEIDLYGQPINDYHYSPRVIDTSIDYNSATY